MVASKKQIIATGSGVVSSVPSSSAGGRSTPNVSGQRLFRFARAVTAFTAPKVERPPIVVEWGENVIRMGHAEKFHPQHLLPLPPPPSQNKTKNACTISASQWYDYVAPLVIQIFDMLMVDPTVHRVVCVTRPHPPQAWEEALRYALWNVGVPAYSMTSFLDVVPMALGWLRGMVIHVGMDEVHCMAHADGHPLYFTYQVVPCGYRRVTEQDATNDPTRVRCQWTTQMEHGWLNEKNPNSLLVAIIKCIEACPRDIRIDIISNLLLCGETLLAAPDLPRRVGLRLKQVFKGESMSANQTVTTTASSVAESSEEEEEENATANKDKDNIVVSLEALTLVGSGAATMTGSVLKPLANHVGLISCAPYRADLISWVGASVCSTIWHRQNDQDDANAKNGIQWVFSPSKKQQQEQEAKV